MPAVIITMSPGFYMFVAADDGGTLRQPGQNARLESGLLSKANAVSFWYQMHMYNLGYITEKATLNVFVKRDGVLGSPVWSKSGELSRGGRSL